MWQVRSVCTRNTSCALFGGRIQRVRSSNTSYMRLLNNEFQQNANYCELGRLIHTHTHTHTHTHILTRTTITHVCVSYKWALPCLDDDMSTWIYPVARRYISSHRLTHRVMIIMTIMIIMTRYAVSTFQNTVEGLFVFLTMTQYHPLFKTLSRVIVLLISSTTKNCTYLIVLIALFHRDSRTPLLWCGFVIRRWHYDDSNGAESHR